jgi:quercetin dioxygenase-like cupin family protein
MADPKLLGAQISEWKGSYEGPLCEDHCSVLKGAAREWHSANSRVLSLPALRLADAHVPLFEAGASIVCISGPSTETLHYHSSHLVGIVTRGAGWLRVPGKDEGSTTRLPISCGDVVVIPKGVLHLFDCDPEAEMDYVALEVSYGPIDYQKHWKD